MMEWNALVTVLGDFSIKRLFLGHFLVNFGLIFFSLRPVSESAIVSDEPSLKNM